MTLKEVIIIRWIAKQYTDIRAKGILEATRKVKLLLLMLLKQLAFLAFFPCAILLVICFRLMRPWLVIRLGVLLSERIGHFSLHPEIYLSGLDLGLGCPKKPFVDIWCFSDNICNQQLANMLRRKMHIWPRCFIRPVFSVSALLPGNDIHCIPHADLNLAFRKVCISENVLGRTKSHLHFTALEEERGFKCIEEMGLPRGSKFICFHGRDSSYLDATYPGDWSYHDYRDVDIQNYLPAVEELTRRGYFAIRMGSKVRDKFSSSNAMVIDYANSHHQSDFMDIFLSAKCEFFLSSGSGIFCPSLAFRRPQIIVNASPFFTVLDFDSNVMFIPKKYWSISHARDMSCQEIFDSGSYRFHLSQCYKEAGIMLIENTSQEILEIVIEAEERYRNAWISKLEDDELQQKFWGFAPEDLYSGSVCSRIGTAFLHNNRHLINS